MIRVGFFCLWFNLVFAQDTLKKDLDEVVISANKFDFKKALSPYQIEKISQAKIEILNTANTATLLEQSGEAFVQRSQGGGGSPVIRGFEANKILLVVDGVRLNNAIYRGGHLQNILRVDQNALETVEILSGPGSLIYGSDALGGVIYLKTKDAVFNKTSGAGLMRYNSAIAEKTTHLDFNIGKARWAAFSSLSFSDFGDIRMGGNFPKNYPEFGNKTLIATRADQIDITVLNKNPLVQSPVGYSQIDFLEKISFGTEQVKHTLNLQLSKSSNIPRYDRLTELENGRPKFAEWYYGPESRTMAAYHFNYQKKSILADKLQFTLAHQNILESRFSRRFASNNLKGQQEQVNVVSANLDLQKNWQKLYLQYGLEVFTNQVHSKANLSDILNKTVAKAETRYPDGGSSMAAGSVYISANYTLNQKLNLIAGLRQNRTLLNANFIEKSFFPFPFSQIKQENNALTANVGINYAPSRKSQISLLGSTGFRSPNIDDLTKVFESTANRLVVPNPSLKPEYSKNIELNAHRTIGPLKIEANGFLARYANILSLADFTFNGSTTILYQGNQARVVAAQNLGLATIKGFNFRALWHINPYLKLSSGYAKTLGYLKNGDNLDHIPPGYGNTLLSFQQSKWQASFQQIYNLAKPLAEYSKSGEDNELYARPEGALAWTVFNTKISYKFSEWFGVDLGVDNLFDRNYRSFASGISAPGRSAMVAARLKW